MSTTSGVSGSSNVWAALNTQRSQHQARMFAKVDTDGNGSVNATELGSMLSDISGKTGTSLGDSNELFSAMDSNADGKLSSDELDAGMQALMPPPSTLEFAQSHTLGGSNGSQDDQFAKIDTHGDGQPSQTGLNAGGPPPAGGAGGAQSASSNDTRFDPLDTNQDGTVSEVERMVGELRDAVAGLRKNDGNTDSATAAHQKIAELAQKIYAQVAQSASGSHTDSLSVTA